MFQFFYVLNKKISSVILIFDIVVLIFLSLMTEVENYSCLSVSCIFSFVKCLFMCFALFLIE